MSNPVIINASQGRAAVSASRSSASVKVIAKSASAVTRSNLAQVKNEIAGAAEIQRAAGVAVQQPDVELISGAALGAFRVVRQNDEGHLLYASSDDIANASAIRGLTIFAAGADGEKIRVREFGDAEFSGWSFTPGGFIYLGIAGAITQTPPATGYLQPLGYAISATRIHIRIGRPVFRN